MMQHHIGRARGVGAGVIADNGIEAEQRLDEVVLEALVEHLAGRAREQVEQIALLLQRQPPQDVGGAERVDDLAHRTEAKALDEVRRRAQHELAQYVGDGFEFCGERADRGSIVLAQFRDRLLGAAFAGQQIAAVGRGEEVLRAALDNPQAVIGKFQIRNDLRVEQAHRVGGDRIAEARREFFGDGGAADHLAALDDLHPQPGHRKISCAGEAVVPRTDDDDVCFVHVRFNKQ